MPLKPEDFITADMQADLHDYNVRPDKTIVAIMEISSDCYEGDLELTMAELESAIAYARANGIDQSVIAAFEDGIDTIQRAEAQDDPENPDLNSLLFGDNPKDPQP